MPAEGIQYIPRKDLLTYEEMESLVDILIEMGVSKVRITGGEPFVRKDIIHFMERLAKKDGLQALNLTTNGVLTWKYIDQLKALGINSVNLSIDTLDEERFFKITRRNELPQVQRSLDALLQAGISTKLNAVVMEGKNEEDLIPLASLTKNQPLDVRFIEEMPFNGTGAHYTQLKWTHKAILAHLKATFPNIQAIQAPVHSTARLYQIPGHRGKIGIIPAFSRTFCGACNRIRITAKGSLKTCLYDNGVLDLREILRSGASNTIIGKKLMSAFRSRAKDGFEAEANRLEQKGISESMSTIGG